MSESIYRSLCNIGLSLSCEVQSGHYMCPDKDSYQIICFQFHKILKKSVEKMRRGAKLPKEMKSLAARVVHDRVLKLDSQSGKLCCFPKFSRETPCPKKKENIVNIVAAVVKKDIKIFKCLKSTERANLISLTALGYTQAALFVQKDNISFTDMMSIYDADFFMEYFWNITYSFMESIQNGQDCEVWGRRLCRYLKSILKLYKNRNSVCRQILQYRNLICVGLEKQCVEWVDFQIVFERINELISQKNKADSLEDFLFISQDEKDVFKEKLKKILLALKMYLESYKNCVFESNSAFGEELLGSLYDFILDGNVNLLSTEVLKGLDLHSAVAWQSDANEIAAYLLTVKDCCLIKAYEKAA